MRKGEGLMIDKQERETFIVQIGNRRDEHFRSVSTPIYLSTAYRHHKVGLLHGYDYIRTGNPTRDVLEDAIADLEQGEQAFACSSGMSAIQLVFSLFEQEDHIIVSRDIYGGSYRLFNSLEKQYGMTFTYWDGKCFTQLENRIQKNTKAIFIETPTNPLMQTINIRSTANVANEHELLLIVDNTLYTPYIQQPLKEGAHIVIHSATKYLAGHNDVLAGLVIAKGEKINEQLQFYHHSIGAVLSPFDCWSLMRGMKTLALRMEKHEHNAKKVIEYLQSQPLVTNVLYPGRSGMVSFEIIDEALVELFLQSLKLFTFAESLGGVESFITYPITQTHADIPEGTRKSYGLSNRLLRISVGIEQEQDLIRDLDQAFHTISQLGGW